MKPCSKRRQGHYRTLLWPSPNSYLIVRESRWTTGKILWGERVKAARAKEAQASSPGIETTPLKPGEIKAELWTDHQFYKIGEPMVITFRASQDCYVTLLDGGTSGNVQLLHPNRFWGGYSPGVRERVSFSAISICFPIIEEVSI